MSLTTSIFKPMLKGVLILAFPAMFTGCAAVQLALDKRDLDVQTKMSDAVFMDPADEEKKRIWVQVKNTSVMKDFRIKRDVVRKLRKAGYVVVSRKKPYTADYWLQVNTRSVGKMSESAAEKTRSKGPGGALVGAAVSYSVTQGNPLVSGALAGALIETIANALVEDVTYAAIVDIKISEVDTEKRKAQSRHQTRMVTTANQVNLEWEDAEDRLEDDVSNAIAGFFADENLELADSD